MKIKKYIAANIQEGKNRIFEELGENAVILSVRSIPNSDNIDDMLVEIIAAIEPNANSNKSPLKYNSDSIITNAPEQFPAIDETDNIQHQFNRLFNEVDQLKSQIYELTEIIRFKNISALSPNARKLYKILLDSGISENMSLNTIIRLNINDTNINIREIVRDAGKILLERINFGDVIEKKEKQQIIGFIGSNGSGKTTSLIKLAIICKLVFEGNVLIISADNIKIGGADQLQSYASITSIPYRAVENNEELLEIIKNEKSYNYIFIDSAGAPQHNIELQNEANNILSGVNFDHKYLVIQSNLSKTSAKSTLNSFKKWKPSSIILSKIDETTHYGEIIEALSTAMIPISYFSSGYTIPDDIEQAERKMLMELFLPELQYDNNKDSALESHLIKEIILENKKIENNKSEDNKIENLTNEPKKED